MRVYCLSTIINGHLRTYSCEDCYIRGHLEGKDRAGDIDFQEIMAQVLLHWFGTPVNTTDIFQIKLVISSIETAGNSVTPSVTHTHMHCTCSQYTLMTSNTRKKLVHSDNQTFESNYC